MSLVNASHTRAMDLAESAILARIAGNKDRFEELSSQALDAEIAAIGELKNDDEPLFSMLHRSAATLAIDCNQIRQAEKLIAVALAKEPPGAVAEDLRDLLERVNFRRHLHLKGTVLEANELQFSLAGPGVGEGMVEQSEYSSRLDAARKLILRTAERLDNRPFRGRGPIPVAIMRRYPVFVSAPRVGSIAATLRVGSPVGQQYLPGSVNAAAVIDELVDVVQLINDKKEGAVCEKIRDLDYRENFVGLTKEIAPDGESVRQVGLTAVSGSKTRSVGMTRLRTEIPVILPGEVTVQVPETVAFVLVGTLRFADATKGDVNKIKVVEKNGRTHSVTVPSSLMNDVVRPHWDHFVQVAGVEKNGQKELRDITPVEQD